MKSATASASHTANAATAQLARSLLCEAMAAFAQIPDADRTPALVALDGFVAAPSPASFLSAVRTLRHVKQECALRQARLSRAEQEFLRGLDRVRREISVEVADVLSALPVFEEASAPASPPGAETARPSNAQRRASGAGTRLRALALLAAAHQELADRVAGSAEKLRQHLARAKDAHAQQPDKPAPRRRSASPRSARQWTTTSTKK
ncbi:MAG: hypothetical protein JNJ46_00920 [Myxococcales bacterium]|nr:hypothetical protein [Myxococcales bacterium]